jgi:hypothetical protein
MGPRSRRHDSSPRPSARDAGLTRPGDVIVSVPAPARGSYPPPRAWAACLAAPRPRPPRRSWRQRITRRGTSSPSPCRVWEDGRVLHVMVGDHALLALLGLHQGALREVFGRQLTSAYFRWSRTRLRFQRLGVSRRHGLGADRGILVPGSRGLWMRRPFGTRHTAPSRVPGEPGTRSHLSRTLGSGPFG